MDESLAEILTRGRRIGTFPARHQEAFIDLLKAHFPDHRIGLLGEKQLELWVHPPLDDAELARWQHAYAAKRRELGLKD